MFLYKNNKKLFFGNYKIPKILLNLKNLQDNGLLWEKLGFYIEYDHHYSATPLDVIPFAGTGGNGIHFGFLTDFGFEKDLSNAPIVCVSPSNDPSVKLVANNLKDFLSILMTIGDAEFLDEDYESEEEIKTRLIEWDEISKNDWKGNPISKSELKQFEDILNETLLKRAELTEILISDFKIEPMNLVYNYIQKIRKDRIGKITINDNYNIGVQYECSKKMGALFDYENKEISKITEYLLQSSKCERIQFYRNSTKNYVLSKDYDLEIKNILEDYLKKDGFLRESKILKKKY